MAIAIPSGFLNRSELAHQRGVRPHPLANGARKAACYNNYNIWKYTTKMSMEPSGPNLERTERLQFMLSADELTAIDEFRLRARMPSRTAAIRELLKRALASAKTERTR
jgi:hypothetical protein